jgi:hypothetical protein
MVQTIAIEKITLYDLEQRFKLKLVEDPTFFREWQTDLPVLTIVEQQRLERVQAAYANLERRSLLENTVKLAVLAPLLDLAGFFLPPFYVDTEKTVEIVTEENGVELRGRMDVLVLIEQIWLLVIESKRAEFSLKVGIPHVLWYMLSSPHPYQPLFGLVTNGNSFIFVKLIQQDVPRYAKSKEFILDQDNGLALTLQILKKIGQRTAHNRN